MRTTANLVSGLAALLTLFNTTPRAAAQGQGGELHVNTFPAGALISCDGRLRGPAPVTLSNLSPGKHLISARHPNHRDVHRTVQLEAGQRSAIELELEAIKGLVLVHSKPDGCTITVDGAERGRTPLLITDLPIGRYRMKVEQDGFFPKEVELTIKDRRPVRQEVVLKSSSAALVINSQPSGASVTIGGVSKGITPCRVDDIPSGQSQMEISLVGYRPVTRPVVLHAGRTEELNITLQPIPAQLRLVSIPDGARIYVGNERKGTSPVQLKNLRPGEYRVRAELPGYAPMFRTIQVRRASSTTEEFRLERNSGTFQITTEPAGVRVFIDGEAAGLTQKSASDETDAVSDPLMVDLLSEGEHQVQLTHSRYHDATFTIRITQNETASLHKKLDRRFIPDHEVKTRHGVFVGELVEIDAFGNIKLETAIGVFKRINAEDILSRSVLTIEKE